jgi:hypothetical protein
MRYVEPKSCSRLAATALELYFYTLQSRFFCHAKGMKNQEQVPYAHVLTNK